MAQSRRQLIAALNEKANKFRRQVIQMVHRAQSGHIGGSLSSADIVTALYFHELRHRPQEPDWPERDRFVLSKGHACPLLYSALAEARYFSVDELPGFRHFDTLCQGHPCRVTVPGVELSTGSLGHGLSFAVGIALMGKLDKKDYRVYVLLSDGELDAGSTWEGAMAASHFGLDNLLAMVDYNKFQSDGAVEEIMPLEPLVDKWRSFNWQVMEIDGNDLAAILNAFQQAKQMRGAPTVIIAHTIKGKGVSFMQGVGAWHAKPPTDEQVAQALQELGGEL